MLLVDFTTEVGVNASADIHSEKSYLSSQLLLTYKKLYHRALLETDIIVDVYIAHSNDDEMTWSCERLSHYHVISVRSGDACNLKQVTSSNGIMSSYVMAAWQLCLTYRHTDTRTISLTIIYACVKAVGHLTMAVTLSILDLQSVIIIIISTTMFMVLSSWRGRLSRPRHCSKGAQSVPKAVYRSDCRDKHDRPRWDSNLGPLAPQYIITRNSSGDKIVNLNFLCDDILHDAKYNTLVHKFRHRSTRLWVGSHVYQIQWNNTM